MESFGPGPFSFSALLRPRVLPVLTIFPAAVVEYRSTCARGRGREGDGGADQGRGRGRGRGEEESAK